MPAPDHAQPAPSLPIIAGGGPRDSFVVVDKPAGLLSTPGKGADTNPALADCVAARVRAIFPRADGPLIAHRLDMDTSGLMVLGLSPDAHRHLSRQFEFSQVRKRYLALVVGHHEHLAPGEAGVIALPLRPDLDHRPRQIVDLDLGRSALTRYLVLSRELASPGFSRVTRLCFMPLTGRSHQLRVHAAHAHGLAAPIMGDPLYSSPSGRLHLHAEWLEFLSPDTGERISAHSPVPF